MVYLSKNSPNAFIPNDLSLIIEAEPCEFAFGERERFVKADSLSRLLPRISRNRELVSLRHDVHRECHNFYSFPLITRALRKNIFVISDVMQINLGRARYLSLIIISDVRKIRAKTF